MSGACLHCKKPITEPFIVYLFNSRKMSEFNDFEAIHISKKHKNINNKQNTPKSFDTKFDKTQ